ncbi:hypothetical protein D3C75_489450 [compost metagenome]
MIKSGELAYTSVVKHGKSVKTIDVSELIRVFGSFSIDHDCKDANVKIDDAATSVNSDALQDLQHRIALLQTENEGLKDAISARDEHISSLRQAMLLLEHKQEDSGAPESQRLSWWKFWK